MARRCSAATTASRRRAWSREPRSASVGGCSSTYSPSCTSTSISHSGLIAPRCRFSSTPASSSDGTGGRFMPIIAAKASGGLYGLRTGDGRGGRGEHALIGNRGGAKLGCHGLSGSGGESSRGIRVRNSPDSPSDACGAEVAYNAHPRAKWRKSARCLRLVSYWGRVRLSLNASELGFLASRGRRCSLLRALRVSRR